MVSHRDNLARLGRPTAHRLALLRNMVTSLLQHERIMTTHTKAKACQRVADRMIEIGKHDTHNNRTAARAYLYSHTILNKLFSTIGPRYVHRAGGYTRVIKAERRVNDDAPMSYIELVDRENELRATPSMPANATDRYAAQSTANQAYQNKLFGYRPEMAPKLGSQHVGEQKTAQRSAKQ